MFSALGKATAGPGAFPLQLEVFVNGHATGLIGTFEYQLDGRMRAKAGDLRDLGIETGVEEPSRWLNLAEISGLTHRYDEPNQTIHLKAGAERLAKREFRARATPEKLNAIDESIGGILNYTLIGLYQEDRQFWTFADPSLEGSGLNTQLEGRIFGPYGTVAKSALVGMNLANDNTATRLDTAWSRSDPDSLVTWRVGDTIGGALDWTRPIRLAGIQYQRNFALRPDLVTMAMPTVSGSAAVPSTVDVYINNTKAFSRDVGAGPFSISELPTITGAGTARIVVRDAAGNEQVTTTSLYNSPRLLREGLYDFSVEAGVARRNYGTVSNDYDNAPAASGTLRYGVYDDLTVETHAEFRRDLANAGVGASTRMGSFGIATFAGSASSYRGAFGMQVYAAAQAEFWGITLAASSRRAFGAYADLATATAQFHQLNALSVSRFDFRPSRSLDVVSIGMPIPDLDASLNFAFVNSISEAGTASQTVTGSVSKRINRDASLYATGFYDVTTGGSGVFAGLTMALGDRGLAVLGVTSSGGDTGYSGTYVKSAGHEPGSFGWRVHGNRRQSNTWETSVTYQASKARVRGSITKNKHNMRGLAVVDGAIAVTEGGAFLSNRIDDAFAVVDAGTPGVEVHYENRPIGKTGADGRLIVPGLRSYEKNKITIDPRNLPVDAQIQSTERTVVPADRHGVTVKLNIKKTSNAALVSFKLHDGSFPTVGEVGVVTATGEQFVIGYDGQAFIQELAASNTVTIGGGESACTATFAFAPSPGRQVSIEDVVCN